MSSVLDEAVEGFEPSPDILSVLAGTKPPYLLALDVGTSGVRAALFDELGREIDGAESRSARRSAPFSPFGELDADLIVHQVIETIDELLKSSLHSGAQIEFIALSCFWHSLMGVDLQGRPTTPVLTWADTRGSNAVKQLRERFDERDVHNRTGCRFHPSYWSAKLLWLRSEQPDTFQNTNLWLGFSEYLSLRLFAETAASVSMASATGLFNQRTCDWDWDLVRALDIPTNTLPAIRTGASPKLSSKFADRWPSLAEARLAAIVGDGAANNIGGGCCTKNKTALMVGTSGAMRVIFKGAPPDQLQPGLWCYRVDRAHVVVGGALSDGGGLYRWLTESMTVADEPTEIEEELAAIEPDSHGLTILPFWSGERSTGWLADARGAILGLRQQTEPIEIIRAAMEGIAYRFALIARALDKIAPGAAVVATGNALRSSAVWRQIIADVLGRTIMFGGSPEASTRGAALLGLEAVGKIGSIEDIAVRVDELVEPDMTRHARYQQGLARQEELYERLFQAKA
jgi:gluconokinase